MVCGGVRGSGEGEWCEEGWDSSIHTVIIQKTSYIVCSFINLAHLASCSRVLCTGSDTAQIEKA